MDNLRRYSLQLAALRRVVVAVTDAINGHCTAALHPDLATLGQGACLIAEKGQVRMKAPALTCKSLLSHYVTLLVESINVGSHWYMHLVWLCSKSFVIGSAIGIPSPSP